MGWETPKISACGGVKPIKKIRALRARTFDSISVFFLQVDHFLLSAYKQLPIHRISKALHGKAIRNWKNSTVPARLFVTGIGSGADIGLLRKFAIPEKKSDIESKVRARSARIFLMGFTPPQAEILGVSQPIIYRKPFCRVHSGRFFGVKEDPESPKIFACGGRIPTGTTISSALISIYFSFCPLETLSKYQKFGARLFFPRNGDGRFFFNFGWP